jgi:putative hemolysin
MQFVFLFVLILINAFFAAAEMAIVSVNRGRIRQLAQDGDRRARLLMRQFEHPNKFLSTIQVAITLAGFLASASAATALSDDVGMFLTGLGIPYGEKAGMVLVTLALSYVTLVFGELFPKRIRNNMRCFRYGSSGSCQNSPRRSSGCCPLPSPCC